MTMPFTQPGLFDTTPLVDQSEQRAARERMRTMIERLSCTTAPPWKTQTDVILDDGAFRRAMRLLPKDEAQTYWAEFDSHMQRLYDIWSKTSLSQEH